MTLLDDAIVALQKLKLNSAGAVFRDCLMNIIFVLLGFNLSELLSNHIVSFSTQLRRIECALGSVGESH